MASLLERYANKIKGVLSCFDRVIIQGTLPGLCHAAGMTAYLNARKVRIFDYPRWAEQWRDQLRSHVETVAAAAGLKIEFIKKVKAFRKEDRIQEILATRGTQPGLVHIFSAMEPCPSYKPWHDKETHQTFLKPDSGKCLHYYFYFIDPALGLCYLRLPTWCPFRLQFYFNGHNWLAARLRAAGIAYEQVDNAFVDIADFARAQALADDLRVARLHRALDRFAQRYCPILTPLDVRYHWSLMQVEYATDLVFTDAAALAELYEPLTRTAIHAVKAQHIATFLGHKLTAAYGGELGTDFTTRLMGTRIKHHMGAAALKMYDKFGRVLRIETTANDVTFFKHHRAVEQKDGQRVVKLAPVRKTIYSLCPDLRDLLLAANLRYLAFLSDLGDPRAGVQALRKVCAPVVKNGHNYRGLNFFAAPDQTLCEHLVRGEFLISGVRNKDLRTLTGRTTAQISHVLKRLRVHGLLKKIAHTYKYYFTALGRRTILAGLKLKTLVLIPALAPQRAAA
jgi:hypothetical protein